VAAGVKALAFSAKDVHDGQTSPETYLLRSPFLIVLDGRVGEGVEH
jgi:hypothetical protein